MSIVTCRDLTGLPPRPIPPLAAYDGVSIYAKRWGRIRTYKLPLFAAEPDPAEFGWEHPWKGYRHTWVHPDLPGMVLSRDLERRCWILAQEFTTAPHDALLDRVADWVFGPAARLVSQADLPLRIRLPVTARTTNTKTVKPAAKKKPAGRKAAPTKKPRRPAKAAATISKGSGRSAVDEVIISNSGPPRDEPATTTNWRDHGQEDENEEEEDKAEPKASRQGSASDGRGPATRQ